jgi:gag-polypeptide of LTR copia-type
MQDGEDVHAHLERFIDAVDKLKQLELEINDELLTIMLLSILPPEYEEIIGRREKECQTGSKLAEAVP